MKKILLCLCMILLLAGCSPKIDYAFFQENGKLIYVMEHNDKTKEEFESENKKLITNLSEKRYEEFYNLLTPSLTLQPDENILPCATFEFGSIYDWISDRNQVKYEIDETTQKIIVSGSITAGDSTLDDFVYTFKIIDCEKLQFIAEESSSVNNYVELGFISVSDGAIFHLQK